MTTETLHKLRPEGAFVPQVTEADYQGVQAYIASAEAVARLTYKSVYIIDYARMGFLYVSDNPLFLAGLSAEEVKDLGYEFYARYVPEEDMQFLQAVNRAGFEFFGAIPRQERLEYTISYNFSLEMPEGQPAMLINHQITPLALDSSGNMWLGLCFVSLAPTSERHRAYILASHTGQSWSFTPREGRWRLVEVLELSEQEKAVIRLANQGLSIAEIARRIHRSEDSVKGYRKKLFAKLGVESITEAVAVATHRRLL